MVEGEYIPRFEDAGGYLYQAPQKVSVKDMSLWSFLNIQTDGGLYFERTRSRPNKIYILGKDKVPVTRVITEPIDIMMNP